MTIDGMAQVARPGLVAIVPAQRSTVRSMPSPTTATIIVDYPLRPEFK